MNPPLTHDIQIEQSDVGGVPRYRAVCSCRAYRSTRERDRSRAVTAGWQHCRRLGATGGNPDSSPVAFLGRRS